MAEFDIKDGTLSKIIVAPGETEVVIPDSVEFVRGFYGYNEERGQYYTEPVLVMDRGVDVERLVFPEGVRVIGERAFIGADSLREIVFPESLVKIEYAAFAGCMSLESIVLPGNLKEIRGSAFARCDNMKMVSSVDSDVLLLLGDGCFGGCKSLSSFVIDRPLRLPPRRYMVTPPFYKCLSLTEVICKSALKKENDFLFIDGNLGAPVNGATCQAVLVRRTEILKLKEYLESVDCPLDSELLPEYAGFWLGAYQRPEGYVRPFMEGLGHCSAEDVKAATEAYRNGLFEAEEIDRECNFGYKVDKVVDRDTVRMRYPKK